jgi:hypothetical protein
MSSKDMAPFLSLSRIFANWKKVLALAASNFFAKSLSGPFWVSEMGIVSCSALCSIPSTNFRVYSSQC